MAKYPNVTIKRVARSRSGPAEDAQARGLRAQRAGRGRGQPGPPDHGRARQGRPAAPARRLREGLRLARPLLADAAEPQLLQPGRQGLRLGRPLRALADGRDRRALLQQGQGAEPAEDARRASSSRCSRPRPRATSAIQFGNLDKWPGIHEYESVLGQTADKQAVRDFVFAKEGASFDTPQFTAGGARRSPTGSRRATSTRTSTAPTTTRPGSSSPRARAAFLIAGTWDVAGPDQADGRQGRLHADAGQGPEHARSRWAARACRSRSPRRPRTRTSRRPTSTSSPTRTPPR